MVALVVFSADVQRLATFYAAVLNAETQLEPSGDIRVMHDRAEVLVHSMSAVQARAIGISNPPVPREGASFKPVFDVSSLGSALDSVRATGGVVTDRTFTYEGLVRHDVVDPDGNVVQLRCPHQ